jgi:hypothetical protein
MGWTESYGSYIKIAGLPKEKTFDEFGFFVFKSLD